MMAAWNLKRTPLILSSIMTSMWFKSLTGFTEESPEQVRSNLELDGQTITSRINGRRMACGQLETPTLGELRQMALDGTTDNGRLTVREVVADTKQLHQESENAGSMFQVASQFNLLEMISPSISPEKGVGIYENDMTQGPACAVAAGAGTIYRNYFASVGDQIGQTSDNQIDCLRDMGEQLGNNEGRLWTMNNGYAQASAEGLADISSQIMAMEEPERDTLRDQLRIGIQWDTEVTLGDCGHLVTQAYCSALPVSYSHHSEELWEAFSRIVLEASYEATLAAALINFNRAEKKTVYLTLLGGGAFRNNINWILDAISRGIDRYSDYPLDVVIVSYGQSNPLVQELCRSKLVSDTNFL